MKNFRTQFYGLLSFLMVLASCTNDGIDPITTVDPGPDAESPTVNISYPVEGTTIKVLEEVTSITIRFQVTDDIEVDNITVAVDGSQLATMNNFLDYRIVNDEVTFNNLRNGEHTLEVAATDLEGNTTTTTVNFSKEPPYTPMFAGESLYMPFDGDYIDLITLANAQQVGSPGFTNEAFFGTSAYVGTTDSYLTYPISGDNLGTEFSAAFWYKVSGDPDRAGLLVAGADENRTQGFRLFREGGADNQTIKLNVGTGSAEVWNDGGSLPVNGEWVHIAFTVNTQQTVIYLNGMPINTGNMAGNAIDWTGVEELTIGAGGETFSYWGHTSDSSPMDELRMFNVALTQEDVQNMIAASAVTLYMPFDGDYSDEIANKEITTVGTPSFAGEAYDGTDAYMGAADSYLTTATAGLQSSEFSATFWYKVNGSPDRAGILVAGADENRTQGFRLFREGGADNQTIKLNVGTGAGEVWNDGTSIPVNGEWVYIAFTINDEETVIYVNGESVNTGNMAGNSIDWTGVENVTIGAGGETFSYWGHTSDSSPMDELRFYNKALTADEVQASMNN